MVSIKLQICDLKFWQQIFNDWKQVGLIQCCLNMTNLVNYEFDNDFNGNYCIVCLLKHIIAL